MRKKTIISSEGYRENLDNTKNQNTVSTDGTGSFE